jgi:hypothetical protein
MAADLPAPGDTPSAAPAEVAPPGGSRPAPSRAPQRPARLRIGARGEAAAGALLEAGGCFILARNYRCPFGEIDLIALDQGVLLFVEVKTD